MRRREFITLLGGAALLPSFALAQNSGKLPLIAFLFGTPGAVTASMPIFVEAMKTLGYSEGRDFLTVYRHANAVNARYPGLVVELAHLKPDIIITSNTGAALAAAQGTTDTPVVSAALDDPIGVGLIASYVRPGGRVTGILATIDTLPAKQLQLLVEIVPDAKRVGMFYNPSSATGLFYRSTVESAAATLALQLVPIGVAAPEEFTPAFQELGRERVDALLVLQNPLFSGEGLRIAALAADAKLPTLYAYRQIVEGGGLISYGINLRENYRRTAVYVDQILKGEKPGDLPVDLPTKFELVLNVKVAKTLGLAIPTSILLRADEVIE